MKLLETVHQTQVSELMCSTSFIDDALDRYLEQLESGGQLLITSLTHNKNIEASSSTDIVLQYNLTECVSLIYLVYTVINLPLLTHTYNTTMVIHSKGPSVLHTLYYIRDIQLKQYITLFRYIKY